MHRSSPKSDSNMSIDGGLVVVGTKKTEISKHDAVKTDIDSRLPKTQRITNQKEKTYQDDPEENEEDIDEEDIEEIKLTPVELLHQAVECRDPSFYYKALTLDAERRALQERADQLQHRLDIELRIKSRKLASRFYGWTDVPWSIPMHSDQRSLNDMWGALRSLNDHEYALQDPNISTDFFNNLRQMMVLGDLNSLQNQFGLEYPVSDYFHEYPEIWKAKEPFFLKCARKKKKSKPSNNTEINKKSIVRQKLEEDIAKREAELLVELSTKFKANPIPVSSLIPKYKTIMSTKGNKATEIRQKATEKKRGMIQATLSNTVQDTLFEIKKEEAKLKIGKITSPTIIDAGNEGRRRRARLEKNQELAGLTDEHTFQPMISKHIPDYKKLHLEFNAKLEKKKSARPPTVPLPFKKVQKHQEEGHAQKIKKVKEILKTEKEFIEKKRINRIPYYHSVIPTSMMVEQPHETKAWKLTLKHRKAQEEAKKKQLKQEQEEIASRKEQSKEMAAKLRAKLHFHDKQTSDRHNDNLQRLKNAQKQREQEHKKELKEMTERINQRLALFEQSEIANAKGRVKRDFRQVLEKAGLKGIEI